MDKEDKVEKNPGILKKISNTFSGFNLFSSKGIKIIILVVILIVVVVILLNIDNKATSTTTSKSTSTYTSTMDYCEILENKLENVLSQISGAGSVKVMITVDGSPELVYASDSDSKISSSQSSSTTTTSSTPILVNGTSPLILTENLPSVKGVIVVSSGANDVSIKLSILNAVSTLLDISTDKINVLKGI